MLTYKRLLVVCALAAMTPWIVEAGAERFSVQINAPRYRVKAGSEIRIKIILTNTSNREISFYRSTGEAQGELGGYTLEVVRSKGKSAPETTYQRILKGESDGRNSIIVASGGYVPVKPRETLIDEVVVSKLYDLSQPGKYSIHVLRFDELNKSSMKSNSITVTITP
jgi:hypothetical protein